jgi:hypothetical protein
LNKQIIFAIALLSRKELSDHCTLEDEPPG